MRTAFGTGLILARISPLSDGAGRQPELTSNDKIRLVSAADLASLKKLSR